MANPAEFERRMRKLAARVQENAGKAVRSAAVVADQVVTLSTPVDTGRARANWQANVDAPATGVVEASDKTGQAALSRAKAEIAKFRAGSSRAVHITNNLPYIQALDQGSSAQAPSGMTRRAIQAAALVLKNFKLLV